jgi:hypothetical protein
MKAGGTTIASAESGVSVIASAITAAADGACSAVSASAIAVVESAAVESGVIAATVSISIPAAISEPATVSVSTAIAIVGMTPAPAAPRMTPTPAPRASIPAAEPGTGADEETGGKPVGSIVAIRGAGIWIVRVISPAADWRTRDDNRSRIINLRADADTNTHLPVGKGRWNG